MRLKVLRLAAPVVAVTLTAAACGSSKNVSSPPTTTGSSGTTAASSAPFSPTGAANPNAKPWVIASVAPFSGPAAQYFLVIKPTFNAAANWVNTHLGGVAGRPVKMEYIDDQADPAQGVTALTNYLDSNTPDMVITGPVSEETVNLLPLLSEKKIFSDSNTADASLNNPAKYPYHFPQTPDSAQIATAAISYSMQQGYKNIAFLAPNNTSGQAAVSDFTKAAGTAGVKFESELMDPTLVDATAQMEQLQSAKPDELILDGFGATASVFLKTKAKLQWNIPTLADETFAANNLGVVPDSDLAGVKEQVFDFGVAGTPAGQSQLAQTEAAAIDPVHPITAFWSSAVIWNEVIMAAMAGDKAGANVDDGPTLTQALESYQTIPAAFQSSWFGDPTLGFSTTNHEPEWNDQSFDFVNAGPFNQNNQIEPLSN